MNKKQLILPFLALGLILANCGSEHKGYYDQSAIAALDKLTDTIGTLTSLSVYVESEVTKSGKQTWRQSDVYLSGNNKMHVYMETDSMRKGYWYSGKDLTVYDYDKHIYDIIPAPSTSLLTIDSIHHAFGVEFPAADFFYPTLTDDMMNDYDSIVLLNHTGPEDWMEIYAKNEKMEVFLTIDNISHFPMKMEIYRKGDREGDSYVGAFGNWRLDPVIDDAIFSFTPPERATKEVIFKAKH
jgi:hypothetical protein